MPVDHAKLKSLVDKSDQICDAVKVISRELEQLDPRKCDHTSKKANSWARIVSELQASLVQQQQLSRDMRETSRIQDELHAESLRDKYRFLVERLKEDIRSFFHSLQEFVELPQDFAHQRTWDHCIYDMEMDMVNIAGNLSGDVGAISLDPIMLLLNYRDKVISQLLIGVLFQKAVLDWDLKNERAYADGPMVVMSEQVVNIFSKTETLPCKYHVTDLPTAQDQGPFTYDSKWEGGGKVATSTLSALQARLLTTMREMQRMGKGLRQITSDSQVHISDGAKEGKSDGRSAAAEELLRENKRWFDKFLSLEEENRRNKSQSAKRRQTQGFEEKVEKLMKECDEKDQQSKKFVNGKHQLDNDVQILKRELANLRREKGELAEKNTRMQKESLPVLDKINQLQRQSAQSVELLIGGADHLASMFRLQAAENQKLLQERDDVQRELTKVQDQLEKEKDKNKVKEEELQRKETLYLRTMAARKSIHEAFLEQKARITAVEARKREREADWQEMLKVIEGRENENRQLQVDLRRARLRKEELLHQRGLCMQEFANVTGRRGEDLLANFRPHPTLPPDPK